MVNQHTAHDPNFDRTCTMTFRYDTALGAAYNFVPNLRCILHFRGEQDLVELASAGLSEDLAEGVEAHTKVLLNLTHAYKSNPSLSPEISAEDYVTTARTVARMCVVQKRAYLVNDALQKSMAEATLLRK